ncbi:MAG: archaellar assembly protein FlaJ [Halodesulfurarchaeum sp.]
MATESGNETGTRGSQPTVTETDVSSVAASILTAYEDMNMPVSRYFLLIILPAALFFVGSVIVAVMVELPAMIRLPIPLLGILMIGSAILYPKIQLDQRRKRMQEVFHLYVTHMTTLSTTNIDRVEVFRRVANEDEYGPLSEETRRIVQLVDTWNQSLDDACRMRAKNVPADVVSDFFDRLSYTINAGNTLSSYLVNEQETIIQNYVTIYEGQLENLEIMKDLYLSMVLSVTFALVFATVLPMLTGTDPTLTVSAVVVMYTFVQGGFLYAIYTVSPSDPIWYFPPDRTTATERKLQVGTAIGMALSLAILVGTLFVMLGYTPVDPSSIPLPMYAAIPTTPLLIPGLIARTEEADVKKRDEEFVSFIRALGASESAQQTTTTKVLRKLRHKDFGPLTSVVNDLYKRLNMRLSQETAWRMFAADAHSYLIQKFSEMYLTGRAMGGDPKHLGEIIAENMNEVLQLREQRDQSTITLIGVLYGITAASTFSFFIGISIVMILSGMEMNLDSSMFEFASIINTKSYDIGLIKYLLTLTILINALLASLIIRVVDGGHKVNSYMHFVIMTWSSSLIGVATIEIVGTILAV